MGKLSYEIFVQEDEERWMFSYDHNGLYYDHKGLEFLGMVPWERKYGIRLYSNMIKFEGNIYLIPFRAKDIAVYSIKNKQFRRIALKDTNDFQVGNNKNELAKFWVSVVYRENIILMPHNYPAIVKLDMCSENCEFSTDLVEKIDEIALNGEPYITDAYIENDVAILSVGCADAVVEINLETLDFNLREIHFENKGFNGIVKGDNNIWLAPRIGNKVAVCDIGNCKIKTIDLGIYLESNQYVPFHSMYKMGDNMCFIPNLCDKWIFVNRNTLKISLNETLTNIVSQPRKKYAFGKDRVMAFSISNDYMSFLCGLDNIIYILDKGTNEISTQVYSLKNNHLVLNEVLQGLSVRNDGELFLEEDRFTLDMFLYYLEKRNGFSIN